MRILHVITTLERGGAEKAVVALAIAQARKGHEVCILPLKGIPELSEQLIENRVQVIFDALNQNLFFQLQILRRCISSFQIIHTHLPRAEILVRFVIGKKRMICTRHNSERFFPKAPTLVSSILSRWVTSKSQVIAISQAVLDFLRKNRELHSSSTATVIYYGYEPRKKGSLRKSRSNKDNVIRLGTISRLTKQKNLQLLLRLAQDQILKGRKISVSIVGSGPLNLSLQKLASELGVDDSVNFLGKIDNVFDFLETLDFFFLTSIYEGFGLVLLEASDAEVPVIASNVSSIPEVLGLKHPGLFTCESLNSIVKVFEDFLTSENLMSRTVILQKKRLPLFSMDKYLDSHDALYDYLLRIGRLSA